MADAPVVARQRVRRALRSARLDAGFTQDVAASRLGWSLSKVQRIEKGQTAVSEADLRALYALFGVAVPADLLADARLSRRARFTTAPAHRRHLPAALRQLVQFETVAIRIRTYHPFLVPGLLQTPAMAARILAVAGERLSAEDRRVRLEVRLHRQQILAGPDAPQYEVVIDESVLSRHVIGGAAMADQLDALAVAAGKPHVALRVHPLSEGGLAGLPGPFDLLTLPDDQILYRELFGEDEIEHGAERIDRYAEAFARVWSSCVPEQETLGLIRATAADLRRGAAWSGAAGCG